MFFFTFDNDSEMETSLDETQSIFEDIKHINEYGQEFWYARELQEVLEYSEWRNFNSIKQYRPAKIVKILQQIILLRSTK